MLLTISTVASAQQVSQSVSEFAFDFYKNIAEGKAENLVFSPFSISPAVGMVTLGARGETRQQISNVFHYDLNNEQYHAQMGKIQKDIAKKTGATVEINITNRVWLEKTYSVSRQYKRQLRKLYGAKVQPSDFINAPTPSRHKINSTIESDTKNYIKDLLPDGSITNLTRLVLTNAIYFKGKWEVNIDPKDTHDREFTLSSGKRIQCPTMFVKNNFKTFDGKDFRALQMNYKGGNLSLLIMLPNEDVRIADFEKNLNYNLYKTTVEGLADNGEMKLSLPKFRINTGVQLKDELCKMGMPIAFSNGADFTGITAKNDLKISDIYHKAFIEVSEEGTTAAAATAVVMVMKSAFVPQNIFDVNRPFVYILMDNSTQTILFMGKVEKPE